MINLHNKSPKILVIGDLIIDQYLWGSCDRISPEAPVQIVKVESENVVLGGAGNVVNNLKSLGADVDVISVVSNSKTSEILRDLLHDIGVDTKFLVSQTNRIDSKKSRIVASQQQVVRYDHETSEEINNESQKYLIDIFKKIVKNYEVILLSDYSKGVLTKKITESLIKISKKNNIKVLIDPKGLDYSKYKGAFLLTPNKKEASEATKINIVDDASLTKAIVQIKNEFALDVSIITLSERGIAIYDKSLRTHPTVTREVFDVTGAGDTILASLGFAIACGYDIDSAVEFSNLAAGVVVGKIGSSTATLNEIIQHESNLNESSSEKNIKTLDEISILSKELKTKGNKIVFTNGCFDLLHSGHVKYLETAKSFGDILIVGLNSDESVSNLKGNNRPINNQMDRAYILAALEVVDYVVIFDEDTPYELIKIIAPKTLVKGGDYKNKKVIGQDIVDELKLVKFVEEKSTTQIIKNILEGT
jgi:D-beta-D-heptose 7-phosphate kinase / D-beta-D-heptose 1-phosphate adenosyltransferase